MTLAHELTHVVQQGAAAPMACHFTDAGFVFPPGPTTAPLLSTTGATRPVTETRVSLDHLAEKAIGNNWTKALDADNLQMEFAMPNTYREITPTRHPELRQP